MFKQIYQILDINISLNLADSGLLNYFDEDYYWFRKELPTNKDTLDFCISSIGNKQELVVMPCNERYDLSNHPNPNNYAYQILLRILFDEIKNFLILHAGVVAFGDNALAVSGSPGMGKTTIVMDLLKHGFLFLSDDFCPIHKQTKLVHPFPRSLYIKSEIRKKKSVKISELSFPISNTPQKLKWLICLEEKNYSNHCYRLEVVLKEDEDLFLQELYKIKGIRVESLDNGFSSWSITYNKGNGLTLKLKELLNQFKGKIWNADRIEDVCPDFIQDASLTPINTSEAAFFLLREFKSCIDLKDESINLFMMLLEILKNVSCYRLCVGRLDSMKDLILNLIKKE